MSKRPNPAAIGAFVLGAIALLIMGVALLASDRLFAASDRFVIHFDESLQGLGPGAPVAYRGVDIGNVVEITAVLDPDANELRVPVVIELRRDALVLDGEGEVTPDTMASLVDQGLRAQLHVESLVTGRLFVALEFFPGTTGTQIDAGVDLPAIPSVPSPLADLTGSLDQVTMAAPKLLDQATALLGELRGLVSGDSGAEMSQALASGASLLNSLGDPEGAFQTTLADMPEMVSGLNGLVTRLDGLTADLDTLLTARDAQVETLLDEVTLTAESVRRAADQANLLLAENRDDIDDFTQRGLPQLTGLIEDATRAVNELDGLARDIRQDPVRFLLRGQGARGGVELR